MGYDLTPKNKNIKTVRVLIFTWPLILQETGAGYLLDYGDNTSHPGTYIYNGSRGPGSPVSNVRRNGITPKIFDYKKYKTEDI